MGKIRAPLFLYSKSNEIVDYNVLFFIPLLAESIRKLGITGNAKSESKQES
jgi:hypothetical protein